MRNRRVAAVLGVALLAAVPLACSGDDGGGTGPTTSSAGAPTSGSAPATSAPGNPDTAPEPTSGPDDSVVDDSTPVLDTIDTTPITDDTSPPAQAALPGDGPATVGGVSLPSGTLFTDGDQRLTWITDEPVKGAGAVWLQLYAAWPDTGLYPILVRNDDQPAGWEAEQLFPNQPNEIDNVDYEEVLTAAGQLNFEPPRPFQGLAPASSGTPDTAAADAAIAALGDARIALVEASRGADAISLMGWTGNATYDSTEAMAVAVRSWEERFGARLVAVGPNSLTVVAANPPATAAEAERLADEFVLMDPDLGNGLAPLDTVPLGDALVGTRVWTFWWQ